LVWQSRRLYARVGHSAPPASGRSDPTDLRSDAAVTRIVGLCAEVPHVVDVSAVFVFM